MISGYYMKHIAIVGGNKLSYFDLSEAEKVEVMKRASEEAVKKQRDQMDDWSKLDDYQSKTKRVV